jgi:disulfide bond formation protein DsbB
MRNPLSLARALAVLVPAGLLAGAYGFQYVWAHLYPCEMCWWQRYAHMAALALALVALFTRGRAQDRCVARREELGLAPEAAAALAIFASGAVGFYHAGVELHYFPGFTQCTAAAHGASAADMLKAIMTAPVVRCDQIQWQWLGVSMAGWNAIVSLGSALVILWLCLKRPRAA